MYNKIKIKIQKRKLRNAYVKYVKFIQAFSCGETLANHISSKAYRLRQKLIKEHEKMKKIDLKCPSLETKLLR